MLVLFSECSLKSTMSEPNPQPAATINTSDLQTNNQTTASSSIPSTSIATTASAQLAQPEESPSPSTSPPFFTTIQSAMERRTQNWQTNLSNMFQDIRPLVQQAHNTVNHQSTQNLLQQWMPLQTVNERQHSSPTLSHSPQFYPITSNHSTSRHSLQSAPPSVVINFDNPVRSATMIDMSRLSAGPSSNNHAHSDSGRPLNLLESRRTQLLATLQQDNTQTTTPNNNTPDDAESGSPRETPPNDTPPLIAPGPTADILAQIPEVRALLQALFRYLPYVLIVLTKTLLDHMDGILDVLALVITFTHANWLLCQEVGRQTQRSVFKLIRELVYIALVIGVITFMLEKRNIFFSVVFAHQFSDLLTLRNLLFSVLVTDFVLKLLTVALKIVVTLLPANVLEYKNRVGQSK